MIYTVTPNPALDLGGAVDRIVLDEKNYVYDDTRFPGGNAINSGRIAARLGSPVVCMGFLGGGAGEEIKTLLDREKIKHDFTSISEDTRINVTVTDRATHRQTRLSFPGPHIKKKEIAELLEALRNPICPSIVAIGGSLPPGVSTRTIKNLVASLRNKNGILAVVDMPGHLLRDVVDGAPFLIKPNLTEFQDLIGRKVDTIPEIIRQARKFSKKVPCICISSVNNGALLVTETHSWYGTIPKIKIRGTTGAGDSMVGAMVARLWKFHTSSKPLEGDELLRWALAGACASLGHRGTQLGTAIEIRKFLSKIKVSRVA